MSETPSETPPAPTSETARQVQRFDAWLRTQTLEALLPRAELQALLEEAGGDDAAWQRTRPHFERLWTRADELLRAEQRPLEALLSPEARTQLLDAAAAAEPDPEAVRAFLRSPAIEAMLGAVLYEGINEFLRRADLLGNMLNQLPVIGGIRRRVMDLFKEEVETRLGGQIKGFLGGFSGRAVEKMIGYVLSEEHRPGFREARRRLAEHLLRRPVTSLVPDAQSSLRWRDAAWEALREGARSREAAPFLDKVWAEHGAEPVGGWAWPLSPRGRDRLAAILDRFQAAGS